MYNNAQILAAVLTYWARPVISQITTEKLFSVGPAKALQQTIINTGLVNANYSLSKELMPFTSNIIDTMVEPMLESYLSKFNNESLPGISHAIVDTALQQPKFAILDGLIEFEQADILELKALLDKNLPLQNTERYQIKR